MSVARLPLFRPTLLRSIHTTRTVSVGQSSLITNTTSDKNAIDPTPSSGPDTSSVGAPHPADVVAGKVVGPITERLTSSEIAAETINGAPSESQPHNYTLHDVELLHLRKDYTRNEAYDRRPVTSSSEDLPTHQIDHAICKGQNKAMGIGLGRTFRGGSMGEPSDGLGFFCGLYAGYKSVLQDERRGRRFCKSRFPLIHPPWEMQEMHCDVGVGVSWMGLMIGRKARMGLHGSRAKEGKDPTQELRYVEYTTRVNKSADVQLETTFMFPESCESTIQSR